jgi:large subunit ribosomal protein L21
MYAIIKTGAKQYRVKKGDVIEVELVDAEIGDNFEFREVLYIGSDDGMVKVGTPLVANSHVKAELVNHIKGPKIKSIKYKKRKNEYRKFGHRQNYAQVKIIDIVG